MSNVTTLQHKQQGSTTVRRDTIRPVPEGVPDPLLIKILAWRRKHASPSEAAFNAWLLKHIQELCDELNDKNPYPKAKSTTAALTQAEPQAAVCGTSTMDQVICIVPKMNGDYPDVLFSSHVDTQDHGTGNTAPTTVGLVQTLDYDANFGHIVLGKDTNGGCLGADDGVGVWIMLNMIEAGIPGAYVFHRGEEVGGLGSRDILAKNPEWLKRFKQAVAFDRPNDTEIIATQGGMRCASNAYSDALAVSFNALDEHFQFHTSHNGIFTDVRNYRGAIPECVNIGVGYWGHHSTNETLDYGHALAVCNACLKIDWATLPISRDPTVADAYTGYRGYSGGSQRSFAGYDFDASENAWRRAQGASHYGGAEFGGKRSAGTASGGKVGKGKDKPKRASVELSTAEEIDVMGYDEVLDLAKAHPKNAAAIIIELAAEVTALNTRLEFLRDKLRS